MSAPKLRRCPACGKRPTTSLVPGGGWFIGCSPYACGVRGPWAHSEADAIAAWKALPRRPKRRKAEAAVDALLHEYLIQQLEPWGGALAAERVAAARRRVLRLMGIDDARDAEPADG